jgi:hypothetical protein
MLMEKYCVPVTDAELINKGALEAFVPALKPLIRGFGQQPNRRRTRAKNGSL